MIGCEHSLQFHRHFYGDEPPRVEMCPRRIAGERKEPTLLKCCLLETHIEPHKNTMVVPWGADLAMIEAALRKLRSLKADAGGKKLLSDLTVKEAAERWLKYRSDEGARFDRSVVLDGAAFVVGARA